MAMAFELNGRRVAVEAPAQRNLLWALRTDLGLTGTKYGCGEGSCGACTVLVDDEPVRACQAALAQVAGRRVLTIEGLAATAPGDSLHPLQQAFVEHGALQCGYCTGGMLLGAYALLKRRPQATREDVVAQLDRTLCRCGAHQRILAAVLDAGRRIGGQP
jgi:aerobic-type carbon monoxide dehydrogenase small subunit (CoxS/CutS family)